MKLRASICLAAWAGILILAGNLEAQTFSSVDTPTLAVPDPMGPGSSSTSQINVPTGGSILDVNVQLSINYEFEDTAITLQSPQGTIVPLVTNSFADDDTSTFLFDDAGAPYINQIMTPGAGIFPDDGTYAPQAGALLSSFNGEDPTGIWTLTSTLDFGKIEINGWNLILVIDPPAPIFIAAPEPVTRRVIDFGSIMSAETSGLGMGLVNQQVVQGAPNTVLRDFDSRLFRARSGLDNPIFADGFESGDTSSWFGASSNNGSSLLRHLAFVQDENMSYKVALGLADPEERTVEVNVVDTLSAQTGTNFNGQSMSGGLPFAMMGVPMMPMAGGAATVNIVEAAPSGKTVIDDSKAVIESEPLKRWEMFVAGDFSFYDQDQLSDLMQGFDTDTYAGTVGLEYRIKEWLNLGLGWSYLQSDTNVSGNYGNIDLEGNMITGYATAFWRQYWADLLYSYGSFNNNINRNTGLGSRARGDTDSQSHNIRLNFGRNFNVGNNITTGPIAGLQYANGDIDPYSESGGGSAALDYRGTDFESMISRLGWQATHFRSTGWGRLVSQVHLAWVHEYMPENGTVGASLQTSPFALVTGSNVSRFGGYSTESDGAHPGTDWLSAGIGLRFEMSNGVAFLTDYEGVFFRNNSSNHYASAKLSYEWGAFMPSSKSEDSGESGSGKAVAYEAYEASSEPVASSKPAAPAHEPEAKENEEVSESPKKKSGFFSKFGKKKKTSKYVPYSEPVTAVESSPEPVFTEAPESNVTKEKVTSSKGKSDFASWLASKGR